MNSKERLRRILDCLTEQLESRLPQANAYGSPPARLDTQQLAEMAAIAKELSAAEQMWAAIPEPVTAT